MTTGQLLASAKHLLKQTLLLMKGLAVNIVMYILINVFINHLLMLIHQIAYKYKF